jgi:coenzyme F420 hydrogenase subunit beta
MLFSRKRKRDDHYLGFYDECLGGFARDETIRKIGAGGGATVALLSYALQNGIVDGAIVTTLGPQTPWRPRPELLTSPEELARTSDYSYTVVPNNALWNEVKRAGLRKVALVGLPCHIHGLRKMQLVGEPREILDMIAFSVGVTCHMNFFAESTKHVLIELCGVSDLDDIVSVTFHGGRMPKHLVVRLIDGQELELDTMTHFLWAITCFAHERCKMCCDWSAEVADISTGEFWEPWIDEDSPGWSSVLTRTTVGSQIVKGARELNYLYARPTAEEYLIASFGWEVKKHAATQRLSWRMRHEGYPTPDYGYDVVDLLELRPAKFSPWAVPSRLAGLFGGVPDEERR